MANNYFFVKNGINIVPAATSVSAKGDIAYNSSTDKIEYYDGGVKNVVSETGTQTLTNKTLSGNTAVTLISGSGTLTLNTSGTITVPGATDTLVGKATTDTLTNKSISGSTNTLSAIANGSLTNSSVTIGSTSVSLGATAATIAGLTLTSPTINAGALSGTFSGSHTLSGVVTVSNTTNATSSTTGAVIISGGVGIAKDLYLGGSVGITVAEGTAINFNGTTNLIYGSNTSNYVRIRTNGTDALLVDSSQNSNVVGALQIGSNTNTTATAPYLNVMHKSNATGSKIYQRFSSDGFSTSDAIYSQYYAVDAALEIARTGITFSGGVATYTIENIYNSGITTGTPLALTSTTATFNALTHTQSASNSGSRVQSVIVNTSASASTTADLRLQNNAGNQLILQRTSSSATQTSPALTGGPTTEQAIIYTNTAVPIVIGTNGTSAILIGGDQKVTLSGLLTVSSSGITIGFTQDSSATTPRNNLAWNAATRMSGAAAITINGIGAAPDGTEMKIVNVTGNPMTITDNSGSATGSVIRVPGLTGTKTITSGGSGLFVFDATNACWRLTSFT